MGAAPRSQLRLFAAFLLPASFISAQFPGRGTAQGTQLGVELDREGKGIEARKLFQKAIDDTSSSAAKANAQRAMAMSWAFEGNCKKTVEYEQMVIDYWVTREKDQPQFAFYQQGEMADEAARVCIDSGDLEAAAEWYRNGHEFGINEPGVSADRRALWDFRWEHAQARIAARRANRAEAEKHIAAARAALDKMTDSRSEQESFFPYLTGYVAFYLGDYKAALADLEKAPQDPFITCLIGQTYEKLGDRAKAMEYYRKAAESRGHNPPAAYAVPFARKKLGQ
jgi:tetratricopeptide (TPR) repeat protein